MKNAAESHAAGEAGQKLAMRRLGEDGLEILYTSPRRLCAMLRGLVEGTGRVYGEALEVEEPACMHHGAPACRVLIRFPWTSRGAVRSRVTDAY